MKSGSDGWLKLLDYFPTSANMQPPYFSFRSIADIPCIGHIFRPAYFDVGGADMIFVISSTSSASVNYFHFDKLPHFIKHFLEFQVFKPRIKYNVRKNSAFRVKDVANYALFPVNF